MIQVESLVKRKPLNRTQTLRIRKLISVKQPKD